MKIALAQINSIVGDIDANCQKILQFAQVAQERKADLIIFPELTITGYPPGDLLLKPSFVEANLLALEKLAKQLIFLPTIVGYVDKNYGQGRPLYNACAFLKDGKIQAKQYKTLLPTYDVFDEDRYFEVAKQYQCISLGKTKIGLTICEDAWSVVNHSGSQQTLGEELQKKSGRYFVDPLLQLAAQKPDFIVNISASPFVMGKHQLRENLLRYHALQLKTPLIFVNQVGGNDELIFDGRSFVIDASGNIVSTAKAFEEDLLVVDIDEASKKINGPMNWRQDQDKWEIYRALVLGTGDYVRKCGFEDVVLGLSGGIDSAVTAAIACKALGPEHVLGVCMPSPYSSPGSITDSELLAKNLGMQLVTLPIEKNMQALDEILKIPFSGKPADVTEENIQARLRGTILMAFSNKFKRMVLATGNKSELSVGYCTLYGDMCGGLAVISDVPKMRVYELAKLINEEAGYDLIPKTTIEKAPSAELRPDQKDEDSLPPYPVLDAILEAYIEEGKTMKEIISAGYAPQTVAKIIKMIDNNEFKRKQAPPGLKLTARAFGVGWRMPIAQRYHESVDKEDSACLKDK